MASLLISVRHAPYGTSLARAGVDTALAAAAFEQPVTLLFQGAGVLNLLPAQDAAAIGAKDMARLLASLPLYDIETLYVDAAAAERYGIADTELPAGSELLDSEGMRQLLLDADHLLGF